MLFLLSNIVNAQTPQNSIEVVVLSDLNASYGSVTYPFEVHQAVNKLIELQPDIVLITGDMVAGQFKNANSKAMWNAFHTDIMTPLSNSGIIVAPTPGNHDASGYSSYKAERKVYIEYWSKNKPNLDYLDDSHFPLYYSFTIEDTLFVSLDDTKVGPLDSMQQAWLRDQLSYRYDTKIVYGHLPLYPVVKKKNNEVIGDPNLERLFINQDVDLFISGHHHAYFPGRRNNVRYLSMPCLGDGSRLLWNTNNRSAKGYVTFDIYNGEIINLDSYTGEHLNEVVPRSSLPLYVGSDPYIIERDDISIQSHRHSE